MRIVSGPGLWKRNGICFCDPEAGDSTSRIGVFQMSSARERGEREIPRMAMRSGPRMEVSSGGSGRGQAVEKNGVYFRRGFRPILPRLVVDPWRVRRGRGEGWRDGSWLFPLNRRGCGGLVRWGEPCQEHRFRGGYDSEGATRIGGGELLFGDGGVLGKLRSRRLPESRKESFRVGRRSCAGGTQRGAGGVF